MRYSKQYALLKVAITVTASVDNVNLGKVLRINSSLSFAIPKIEVVVK